MELFSIFDKSKILLKLMTIILACLISATSYSQNSFGLEFGRTFQWGFGTHQLDSVFLKPRGSESYDSWMIGGFFELGLSGRFSVQNKVSFNKTSTSYLIYNSIKECMFCPVIKGGGIATSRLSMEVLPQFTFLKFNKFKFNLFGGVNGTAVFVRERPQSVFQDSPGAAKVSNSLETSPIPLTFTFAYGSSVEFEDRFVIWAKWLPSRPYSKEIEIDGELYPFENNWKFFTLSIGYKFYNLKVRKK